MRQSIKMLQTLKQGKDFFQNTLLSVPCFNVQELSGSKNKWEVHMSIPNNIPYISNSWKAFCFDILYNSANKFRLSTETMTFSSIKI